MHRSSRVKHVKQASKQRKCLQQEKEKSFFFSVRRTEGLLKQACIGTRGQACRCQHLVDGALISCERFDQAYAIILGTLWSYMVRTRCGCGSQDTILGNVWCRIRLNNLSIALWCVWVCESVCECAREWVCARNFSSFCHLLQKKQQSCLILHLITEL